MYNFEKLEVWKKARAFIRKIYEVTAKYPREEKFGLTQHTRDSAI
ncbi:MAG: four helix bundle protein, partial [Candidatus Omnitrophica bacterium]|nr:four helix bundle protein [Candidatus Omnitrophota bacterium]